jgi:hypothetical protein
MTVGHSQRVLKNLQYVRLGKKDHPQHHRENWYLIQLIK